MATNKVEANIGDQINYTKTLLEGIWSPDSVGGSFQVDSLFDVISALEWSTPLYDDTKPSYSLSFNAPKTADMLAGTFSIKHNVSGDYQSSSSYDNISSGTLTDTISASYGIGDKLSISQKVSKAAKIDNTTGDVISHKDSSDFKETLNSTNNTPEKNDDYQHAVALSSVVSASYISKSSLWSTTDNIKFSDSYKSTNLNYSVVSNSTSNGIGTKINMFSGGVAGAWTDGSPAKYNSQQKYDETYSNNDIENGLKTTVTLSYTDNYSYSIIDDNNYSSTGVKTFSKVSISVLSNNDPSSNLKLDFSGSLISNGSVENYNQTLNLKSLNITTPDIVMSSKGFSNVIVDMDFFFPIESVGVNRYYQEKPLPLSIVTSFISKNEGDDTIAIKNAEGYSVDAGSGNDVVVGGIGDDTITGGAGSDKLTGGKGLDTFRFVFSDFISENASGVYSGFNKSADTITDFNLKDGDVLDFGEMGQLGFYKTLNDAKADEAQLFYVKGQIYYNVDTTGEKYTPTVIITLTGNPALNADGTDFNYPFF